MFRINSIMNENRDVIQINDSNEDTYNNYYTIITGDNASGKSSLLSKAINFFLFPSDDTDSVHFLPAVVISPLSEIHPSKIIALCNSKFDKFASTDVYEKLAYSNKLNANISSNNKTSLHSMFYIHPDTNNNARREMTDVVDKCLKNIYINSKERSVSEAKNIRKAFNMFGLQPDLHLKCTINKTNIKYLLNKLGYFFDPLSDIRNGKYKSALGKSSIISDVFKKAHMDELIDIFLEREHEYSTVDGLYQFLIKFSSLEHSLDLNLDPSQNSLSDIYLSVSEGKLHSARFDSISDSEGYQLYRILFFLDIITVTDVAVMKINSSKEVNFSALSSGQRTLLGHAIILGSFVEENCMICIDEPENSLHPEWQLNFMRFISLLCSDKVGAHILIATHSPQIISGMQFDNGCVLTLENRERIYYKKLNVDEKYVKDRFNQLQPLKIYREQSVDKQLTGVFKSPGHRNDLIIRKLLLIISKLSKQISLTGDDKEFITEINYLKEQHRIPAGDPVLLLIQQVESFQNVRHSDDQ